MLKGHTFNKTKVRKWPQCIKTCNDDIRCQSFNYAIDEGICELNKRTKEAKPGDFVPASHRAYMTRSSQRGIIMPYVSLSFMWSRSKYTRDINSKFWLRMKGSMEVKLTGTLLCNCSWKIDRWGRLEGGIHAPPPMGRRFRPVHTVTYLYPPRSFNLFMLLVDFDLVKSKYSVFLKFQVNNCSSQTAEISIKEKQMWHSEDDTF